MSEIKMVENATVKKNTGSPYAVFMWGALLMAVVCFGLSLERIAAKRPARADAYTIAGILGLLSAAAAWSLGSAHERSRRSQEGLQGALEKLQDRMQELPRALMEDSVKVAERERSERRSDQERQAGELRQALETGLKVGFAPLAPALSERIEASLGSLSDSLRMDREERSQSLREMGETFSKLQGFQKEWAQGSLALLEKLREQGTALQREISERDVSWRAGLEKITEDSGVRFQSAADAHLTATRRILEDLTKHWDAATQSSLAKMENLLSLVTEASHAHLEKNSETLLQGLGNARESLQAISSHASDSLRGSAEQAQVWLQSLVHAAEKMQEAAQGAHRTGEESTATQSGFKSSVDVLNQGLTGMLDRLQSFASLAQGQEALLEKMEATIRRFEERAVELLEDNALKVQESFLDALERVESDAASRGA
jgi:hypothetical protein